jgi:CHAT domain-containing protein
MRAAAHRFHPLRAIHTSSLGVALFERYMLLEQKDVLDKAILYLTESLLSSPLSWLGHGPIFASALCHLALSLLMRSKEFKGPEDATFAAECLRHLRKPAHSPFAFQRQSVTTMLVETLALQMELKASDVVQTLQEMAILTHELLTSDPSSDDTTSTITLFAGALGPKFPEPFPEEPLNQIIKCLRLARQHKPELREVHFSLAKCLYFRYLYTLNDELDEAASIVDEIIASSSPGDKLVAECLELVPTLAMLRSMGDGHPETSEEAIYRARAFLTSSNAEDALYPTWSHVLDNAVERRFQNFGPIDGLETSSSGDPLLCPWPVRADETQEMRPLEGLLDEIRNNSITDIEEAVECGRSILASSDPSDLHTPRHFSNILFEAFERTKKIEYLNESIDTLRQLLARRPPKLLRDVTVIGLLRSLIARRHRTQDRHEIVELIPQFLNDGGRWLSLPYRFHYVCIWALYAHETQHSTTVTAYETALTLMQDIAPFSPTLQLQHATLATLPTYAHEIPLAYASYQVEQGQLEKAIETLERGRALLWSEMRRLRTSTDRLLDVDPELGHMFAALNRDLEKLTKSIAPSHELSTDDVVANDLRVGDEFSTFLLRQRGLLKERDKLISQIRALPGFDRFLTFSLFDTLRSAASSGPVIIVNHSELRCDILIILHNASPSLIPTPDHFHVHASALNERLLTSRAKDGLDSSKYNEALASVLTELYELVGKPVIERLRHLQVPDHSRIWWCPTSIFCSLPLHAMGPIPSNDGDLRYFLDFYICSYTPSLSALIQSRNRNSDSRSSDRPSVLLVAQIDPSIPTVGGEIQVVRALDTEVTSLISGAATPASVTNSFQHHQFVHFACHGTLEPGKPFESGFELHGDERLTLLDIVRSNLPTAEFAFLSACHTAEMTEGSIMDEGLHLAAAVQYSGFRSVVGTMWAMVDEDGRDLAENFYKALFSNSRRDQGIPYHERSAKALRFAVKKLRKKRHITLERWVNFVHYGA